MKVVISKSKAEMGQLAAESGAATIKNAISKRGIANVILATGASQFEMLSSLTKSDLNWEKVHFFHLDEYVDLAESHPASFRKYLKERFVEMLPTRPASFEFINAEIDAQAECERLNAAISDASIDVAFIGIGENGHLAFNDPPADFETTKPYIIVELDEACRAQQFGEGWFESLDSVPTKAISMSIKQILKSGQIVCTVPNERKAKAVAGALEGEVTPNVPSSILQTHDNTTIFLDEPAASLLKNKTV